MLGNNLRKNYLINEILEKEEERDIKIDESIKLKSNDVKKERNIKDYCFSTISCI